MAAFVKSNSPTALQAELLAKGPGSGGGNGGGGGGGGRPIQGDLYGDQYLLLRDLDPTDGYGGDGESVLDGNGQSILVGSDGRLIYFIEGAEGDFEIPPADLPFAQTVELERANVARAPDRVMDKSLAEAMGKIDAATAVSTDTAGRIVCDGVTIDSPLENLALYQYLMTAGGQSGWPDVINHWPEKLVDLLGASELTPDWDPSSLLGAAFSKEGVITLDAVLYENSVLGVNDVSTVNGETVTNYFDFSTGSGETYNYARDVRFDGIWIQWYENRDDDPELELVTDTVLHAVFGDGEWLDQYIAASAPGSTTTVPIDATLGGVNDFAQAADDARAVINFMHEHYGAVEVAAPSGGATIMDVSVELVGVSASANGMFAADLPML